MKSFDVLNKTILFALSTFAMKGLSLFMVPIVVHALPAAEFGRIEYLATIAMLLSVLVAFGLEDALFRFCGQAPNKSVERQLAAGIYGLVLLISGIFITLALIISPLLSELYAEYASTQLAIIIAITLSFEAIISVPMGWMRMQGAVNLYCFTNLSRACLQAVLTYSFLKSGRGVEGVFEAGLLAALVTAVVCLSYQLKTSGILFRNTPHKRLIRYSFPIVLSGLLAFLLNGFDRWLLAESTSLTQLAYFAIAAKFALAMTIAMQPYNMWWSPLKFSLAKDTTQLDSLTKYASIGLLQICFFGFFISVLSPFAVIVLFPEEFYACIPLIAPLIAIIAVKEVSEFVNVGVLSKDSTILQMKITASAAIGGALMLILLVPNYGSWGLVLSLFIAQLLRTVCFYIFSEKTVPLNIPAVPTMSLLVLTFGLAILCNSIFIQQLATDANYLQNNTINCLLLAAMFCSTFLVAFLVLSLSVLRIDIARFLSSSAVQGNS